MSKRKFLLARLALAAGFAVAISESAAAALYAQVPAVDATLQADLFQPADARSYHHCHNTPRRIYCHTRGWLPSNWPPNSNTPGTSRLRGATRNKTGCIIFRR
jgi:hypothetical protein